MATVLQASTLGRQARKLGLKRLYRSQRKCTALHERGPPGTREQRFQFLVRELAQHQLLEYLRDEPLPCLVQNSQRLGFQSARYYVPVNRLLTNPGLGCYWFGLPRDRASRDGRPRSSAHIRLSVGQAHEPQNASRYCHHQGSQERRQIGERCSQQKR